MSDQSGKGVLLDVPYFAQTRFSTCGPASLMMVLRFWDCLFPLSRSTEFLLWMKSKPWVFLGGTLQFGLAATAVRLGYHARIIQKGRFSSVYRSKRRFIDMYERWTSWDTRRLQIPLEYVDDMFGCVQDSLQRGIPPIVFVNLLPIVGENVLHWVVVSGFDERMVYVNDPYVPVGVERKLKKNFPVAVDVFQKAMATEKSRGLRLPSCIVLVEQKKV